MAFVVEDGTGKADANAYIQVAFADAYFADRGVTAWTGDTTAKQAAIVNATDYIDGRFKFKGCPLSAEQALAFPRDDSGTLPYKLQCACAEYALRALGGKALAPDPVTPDNGMQVKSVSEKVGPIEEKTEYTEAKPVLIKAYPKADMLLQSLLRPTGGTVFR